MRSGNTPHTRYLPETHTLSPAAPQLRARRLPALPSPCPPPPTPAEPPGSRCQRWRALCSQRQRFPNTAAANLRRAPCASSATKADRWAVNRQQPPRGRKRGFIAPSEGWFEPGHRAWGKRMHFNTEGSPRNASLTPAAGNNAPAYGALKATSVTKAVFAFFPGKENFCPHRVPRLPATGAHRQGRQRPRFLSRAGRTRPERGPRHRLQPKQPARPGAGREQSTRAPARQPRPQAPRHVPGRQLRARRQRHAGHRRGQAGHRPGHRGAHRGAGAPGCPAPPAPWGGRGSGPLVTAIHRLPAHPRPASPR